MNLSRTLLVVLPCVLLTAACNKPSTTTNNTNVTRNPPTATPDEFAIARELFATNCQKCHGPPGTGGPAKLEAGTKLKAPSLREGHALPHPDAYYVKQNNNGGAVMPGCTHES